MALQGFSPDGILEDLSADVPKESRLVWSVGWGRVLETKDD